MTVPSVLIDLAAGRPPAEEPDWATLEGSAPQHGMSGLLYGWAREAQLDPPVWLRRAALVDGYMHDAAAAMLPAAVAAFASAGIPVLTWKGVALAARHYDVPAERPCADIDLLVRVADAPAVATLLDGLAPEEASQVRSSRLSAAQEPNPAAFRVVGVAPTIDVQFSLLRLGLAPKDERRVWQRAVAVHLDDVTVGAPCDAHLFVALLVHLARSRFARLIWFADVARVGSAADLDVEEAARFARAEAVAELAAASADVVAQTLQTALPRLARVPRWYGAAFTGLFPRRARLAGVVREAPVRFVPRLRPSTAASLLLTARRGEKLALVAARGRKVGRHGS